MENYDYFPPPGINDWRPWFNYFATKLESVHLTYGVSNAEMDVLKAENLALGFADRRTNDYREASSLFLTTRNILWLGDEENPDLVANIWPDQVPVVAVGDVPTPVRPGIYGRVKRLVMRLRNHPLMTETMMKNMGIAVKPSAPSPTNPSDFNPVLTGKVVNGKALLDCPLLHFEGYEIWSDDQAGTNFTNGRTSVSRSWTDEEPLPEGMNSQQRSYRVRMLLAGNVPIGNYSNIIILTTSRQV